MTPKLLLVEDNLGNMELADYLLRSGGYEPLKAYDGLQALGVIAEHRPDLVLCDLQMPVMDGYELLRQVRLRADTRDIVVVAVTALSMPDDRTRVMTAGFNGYLWKPIAPEQFVSQVEAYLHPNARAGTSSEGAGRR